MKPNYIDSDCSMCVAEYMNGRSRGRVKVVDVTLLIIIIWGTRVYLMAQENIVCNSYVTPGLATLSPFEGILRRYYANHRTTEGRDATLILLPVIVKSR